MTHATVAELLEDPQEREGLLDALGDVALGAVIPAAVFAVTARVLDIPLAGPLTLAALVLGMVPVIGRGASRPVPVRRDHC